MITDARISISLAFWISCLILFIPGTPVTAQTYLQEWCSERGYYASNSKFQENLDNLLSSELHNKGPTSGFSNATEGEGPDKVYGLFLCRGDVAANLCQACLDSAASRILERCPGQKEAIIWYDDCLLRYSNRSFFSIMELLPLDYIVSPADVSVNFSWIVVQTFNIEKDFETKVMDLARNLTDMVISSESLYVTMNVNVSSSVTLREDAQCTPDISKSDCKSCLLSAIKKFPNVLHFKRGGATILLQSCIVRYELYRTNKNSTEFGSEGMSYLVLKLCTQFVTVSV